MLRRFIEITAPRKSKGKTREYTCSACGVQFMSYPGLPDDWPSEGDGLPPYCDDPDCHEYMQHMAISRRLILENAESGIGGETYATENMVRYRMSGFDAVARRVSERRQMIQMEQGGML